MRGFQRPGSRTSRGLRAIFAATVLGAAVAPAAHASTVSASFTCQALGIAATPMAFELTADYPTRIEKGQPFSVGTPRVALTIDNVTGALGPDVATVEGYLMTSLDRIQPTGRISVDAIRTDIAQQAVAAGAGDFTLDLAAGKPFPQAFSEIGANEVRVPRVWFSLMAKRVDGSVVRFPETAEDRQFDLDWRTFSIVCTPVPSAPAPLLASVEVTPASGTIEPLFVTEGNVTPTSATICWPDKELAGGLKEIYAVYNGDTVLVESTSRFCETLTGLTPGTTYEIEVLATFGEESPMSRVGIVEFTTPAAPPIIEYAYTLAGSATLKTLVKGSLPLTGSIGAKLDVLSGAFTGELALNKTTGNLTALGFLPVSAQVAIVPTAPVAGTLQSGVLKATAKVRIKLPKVTVFGVEIAGGANCQAKQISMIALQSTQAQFQPLSGGPIAGTFSISDLSGCGALTGIVSPLTAGKGNAILLGLTPAR